MLDKDLLAYLGVFLYEVDEQLQIMEEETLKLEQGSEARETIEAIFRAAHTLKGSSGAMGITPIHTLTHQLENVFDLLRRKKLKADAVLIDTILDAIDHLKGMKELIASESEPPEASADLLNRLADYANQVGEAIPPSIQLDSDEGGLQESQPFLSLNEIIVLDDYQKAIVTRALDEDYTVMAVCIRLSKDAVMKSVRALLIHNNLKELGEIVAGFPPIQEIEDEELFGGTLVFVVATQQSRQQIIHVINQISEIDTVNLINITREYMAGLGRTDQKQNLQKDQELDEEHNGNGKENGNENGNEDENRGTALDQIGGIRGDETKAKISQTVRVDVERLEHLLNLVGELIIDQTRLTGVRNRLSDKYPDSEEMEDLHDISAHLSRVVGELQEGMMKTRMFPIEQLFNRFPRMVRDLSQRSGKLIDLEMDGKETELDRTLIEEIGDPIIHLLRNSIDHGIESQEERKHTGKPLKGKITLTAEHSENHIVITVADDGRGINTESLKQIALKKGIINEATASRLDAREALHLIFRPGFSTAEQVTDISGRGVGMDIVKSHIEKLNGMIDIRTTLGEGTVFTIKLPLTLAVNRSLLVQIGSHSFAIPLSQVVEIIKLVPENVKTAGNREVAIVRGKVMPLVRLHQRLGEELPLAASRTDLVVVGHAEMRVALAVDRTLGNQEIVIKSLGSFIGALPYISGATIMGDGGLILILDINSVIREQGSNSVKDAIVEQQHTLEHTGQFVTFWLGCEQFAVDISRIQSIIEVSDITPMVHASPEVLGVINLRGHIIPVIDTHSRLGLSASEGSKQARIMIIEVGHRTAGILVDQVTHVIRIPISQIEVVRDRAINLQAQFVRGIYHKDDLVLTVLDIEKVLNLSESEQAKSSNHSPGINKEGDIT